MAGINTALTNVVVYKTDLMVSGEVILSGWMVEVMPEMRVAKAVVGGNVVGMPLFEELGLTMFAGLGAEHVEAIGCAHARICSVTTD